MVEPVLNRADVDVLDGVGGADECVVDVVGRVDVLPPPQCVFWLRPASTLALEVVGAGEAATNTAVTSVATATDATPRVVPPDTVLDTVAPVTASDVAAPCPAAISR